MVTQTARLHFLIFEPRLGGHHLSWLRYVAEDLLATGSSLTLAVDLRPGAKELIEKYLADLLSKVNMISAYGGKANYRGGSKMAALLECFIASGAEEIFMTNFDELASNTLRLAAFGVTPPKALMGKINGIYFRPRFMAHAFWPPGNMIKSLGFKRLCRGHWFKNIYLLDEYLIPKAHNNWPGPQFHFLPDVWNGNFSHDKHAARQALRIPPDKFVFLNYGIGTRRKGLHLVIRAMRQKRLPDNALLLCAGKIADDQELLCGATELEESGVAMLLNHYVSDKEEELCFAASDAVLLPYVKHFGSSGVLSRAAAAGKLVIASDEGLLARRVREHNLGLLFPSGQVDSLVKNMKQVMTFDKNKLASYIKTAHNYASSCSRQAFRRAIIEPFVSRK